MRFLVEGRLLTVPAKPHSDIMVRYSTGDASLVGNLGSGIQHKYPCNNPSTPAAKLHQKVGEAAQLLPFGDRGN